MSCHVDGMLGRSPSDVTLAMSHTVTVYHIVLYYLYCTYNVELYYATLYYDVLCCIILFYLTLCCVAL